MSKLPDLPVRDVLKVLAAFGYHPDHQTGSHIICRHTETRRLVVLPADNPVAKGTLRAIIREAGLNAGTVSGWALLVPSWAFRLPPHASTPFTTWCSSTPVSR